MNKLKFNEGGQPVYLDDLRLLQENDAKTLQTLVTALGNGTSAFLLSKTEAADVEADESGTTFTLKGGTLVVDGEFLEWEDTSLKISDWNDPIYLCVKETETDVRTFEDGQERACSTAKSVTVTTDNTGATESYNIYELKTLGELLKSVIGYTEYAWKSVNVTWKNGYTGTVRYQDKPESYRVWIKATSTSTTTGSGTPWLFYTEETFLQYYVSDRKAFVRTENGVESFTVHAFEGCTYADISLPFDDVKNPSCLDIDIIFEIPK